MIIRDMFASDINREINGVIQVDQDSEEVIKQEVEEYVITSELRKHFATFFENYSESFQKPTDDIGVWISGFFGSGKSHFLKMLAYILENKEIDGEKTVDYFQEKFKDSPETFALIKESTRQDTEVILFDIDMEGSINKDKTAVFRVFAKMFYDHLGFYGENLKVAKMEQYIEQQGKTNEFRKVFEAKRGRPWVEQRKAFAFNGKYIIPTLMEVLDMSETDATNWFNDKSAIDFSIAEFVDDIKDYVKNKPNDFRLIFMADEVGQYIGTDTSMLLNLQSIIEKVGSECEGKVWIVCTGQEAIDEIIKVREDEFSRIQARFTTRLSLSSSSADEVIQKRILKKTQEANCVLEQVYEINDAALRNLFTFKDSIMDIKGYSDANDFTINYPFVPYQFIIVQKAFSEIRKHGNSGKHFSGGERSMLSGFQEAAQKVQDRDENALVPFFCFYDTVHSFLDSSIRRVIERCQKAADNDAGIEPQDVDVLKLLYLIRYVDDIPTNLDNIVILMADNIETDKIALREQIRGSLDRLLDQNYIGRVGEIYNFLTDEEQDVAREIKNTQVDTAMITTQLGEMIFEDIYPLKKYRYETYDFPFDKWIDNTVIGSATGGMRLRFLTVATDEFEKSEAKLTFQSKGEADVVLPDSTYYEAMENALKIRQYVKQHSSIQELPQTVQEIIRRQQEEASIYEKNAENSLRKSIEEAEFYVDGELLHLKGGTAEARIDQAMEYLVIHVYSELDLITVNVSSDADIIAILSGTQKWLPGTEPNQGAVAKMEEFLDIQNKRNWPTSMADIQSRYQGIPYGWHEIDIAAVAAQLIYNQKVTITYAGTTIQPNDPKLPDMLRKRNEIGKTSIAIRQMVSSENMHKVRAFLREYFDAMNVPTDEDGLIAFIIDKFTAQEDHYASLDDRYKDCDYPGHLQIAQALNLTKQVLSQKKDNIALVNCILRLEDDLETNKEEVQKVEGFFNNQVDLFDKAVKFENDIEQDEGYFDEGSAAECAIDEIRLICMVDPRKDFDYKRIPELNDLMNTVQTEHNKLLDEKRRDRLEDVRLCLEAIHQAADGSMEAKQILQDSDKFFNQMKSQIEKYQSLALLDGLIQQMMLHKDDAVERLEAIAKPAKESNLSEGKTNLEEERSVSKKTHIKVNRSFVFPSGRLESKEDVEKYVKKVRNILNELLESGNGIDIK